MDAAGIAGQRHVMPAPITKLSDCFADYTLRIYCRACRHERITEPHSLAKLVVWETPLIAIIARMRCSKCHSRGNCELSAITTPKPRGYRSSR